MKANFAAVTKDDFVLRLGAPVLAVEAEVRRIGGGGIKGQSLLGMAVAKCGGNRDQTKAFNRLVQVLNSSGSEMTEEEFRRAIDMPFVDWGPAPGLLPFLRRLLRIQ